MTTLSIEEQRLEAKRQIRRLPHASHIRESRIDKWIEDTLSLSDDRLLWHVKRLFGFGGSEMGGMVKSLRNEDDYYSTAHSVCAGKLCILSPTAGDGHAERGQKMEEMARAEFEASLTKQGLDFRRLDEIQRDVIEGQENPVYEWMKSSLDGLYDIEVRPGVWKRTVVDFKCPTNEMVKKYVKECEAIEMATGQRGDFGYLIPKAEIREEAGYTSALALANYSHQIHHYYEDARLKGVEIDSIILSVLDYEGGLKPIQIEMEIDQRTISANIEAGEYYWHNFVQLGIVPDPVTKDILVADNLTQEDLDDISEMLLKKHVAKELDEQSAAIRAKIEERFSGRVALNGAKLDCGPVQFVAKKVVDEDRAVRRLYELGYSDDEIEEMRLPGTTEKSALMKSRNRLMGWLEKMFVPTNFHDAGALQPILVGLQDEYRTELPQKKGDLDPEMVTNALLSCNEDPKLFVKEKLTVKDTRKASIELDHIKDKANEFVGRAHGWFRRQILKPTNNQDQQPAPQPGQN
jgi:hypothetical protein